MYVISFSITGTPIGALKYMNTSMLRKYENVPQKFINHYGLLVIEHYLMVKHFLRMVYK